MVHWHHPIIWFLHENKKWKTTFVSGLLFSEQGRRALSMSPSIPVFLKPPSRLSAYTNHMTGCYITSHWLKIYFVPAKCISDASQVLHRNRQPGRSDLAANPDTAALTSHTYCLRPFISLTCLLCSYKKRSETDLHIELLALHFTYPHGLHCWQTKTIRFSSYYSSHLWQGGGSGSLTTWLGPHHRAPPLVVIPGVYF